MSDNLKTPGGREIGSVTRFAPIPEAYSYYSRHFSIICELHERPYWDRQAVYKFTHQPSGEEYLVKAENCYNACQRLKDKYYGLRFDPIPTIDEKN